MTHDAHELMRLVQDLAAQIPPEAILAVVTLTTYSLILLERWRAHRRYLSLAWLAWHLGVIAGRTETESTPVVACDHYKYFTIGRKAA